MKSLSVQTDTDFDFYSTISFQKLQIHRRIGVTFVLYSLVFSIMVLNLAPIVEVERADEDHRQEGIHSTSVRRVSTRVCSADFWPVRRVASRNLCINSSPRVGSLNLIMWP